jgi:regulator of replication initiation timing
MQYEKGLFAQLTETIEANERLKKENAELRAENSGLRREVARLQKRITEMESTFEARRKEAVAAAVRAATAPLYAEISRKDEEIGRLKSIINKDSSNSSKPPSSDGYKKIPNNRESRGKKRGGQAGHAGNTLTVPKNLSELVQSGKAEHKIVDLTSGVGGYVSRWEIDIKTVTVYTEYRCPAGEMPTIRYGPEMKAYATVLLEEGYMSLERVSSLLEEITYGQVRASVGTLTKITSEAARAVDMESLRKDIMNGEIMHVDESPMESTERAENGKIETAKGTTFDATVRTHSNARTTVYTVNPRKDDEGIERDGIIPAFHGIYSHDHDKKYYKYGERKLHATCHAH